MNTQNLKKHLLFVFIALIPIFYTIAVWQKLPAEIPTHFDLAGHVNGYTDKSWLWILTAINLFVYFLLQRINKVDPKRMGRQANTAINKISIMILLFITALTIMSIVAALHPEKNIMGAAGAPVIGLFFAVLGNYMYNIKPNYFAGFKLPWTLSSDYNWRKTHQLGGRLWFYGGVFIMLTGLLLPGNILQSVFTVLIGIMVIIPIAYSYFLFKNHGTDPEYYEKEKI